MNALVEKLKVKPGNDLEKITYLRNKDIIPMGPERRIWGVWSLAFYWSITSITISTWTGASSLLSLGLSVGETLGIILIGNCIIAGLALLNAAPGGYYHIGYTISQRVVFGIKGAWVTIVMRTILSVVWFASQAYLGSRCLSCIFASWSHSFLTMENTLPESVNMTTQELIGFVVFQVISIPPLLIKPERFNKMLMITCVATFFAMLGIVIWAVTNNGGSNGPLMNSGEPMSSSERGWWWIYGICSWYGSLSSGVANQSDFTRFSKKTWSSLYGTIFSLVVVGTLIPLMGLITASAMKGKYDQEFWRPDQIMFFWLTQDYSSKARAGAFFCGLAFTLSQMCFNTMGNGYAGGMDMAGLFPKFITIKRGAVITALLSWVIQPWDFYNTASTFVTVMASFSVFMSPVVGTIVADFWVVRRRKLKLSHLYTDSPQGTYWFWKGVNCRNLLIWTIAFAPGLPGLINSANPDIKISTGARHFYYANTLIEFAVAFTLVTVSSYIWPYKDGQEEDKFDYFNTWTEEECEKKQIVPYSQITSNDLELDTVTSILSREHFIVSPDKS